jgi:hypothetical protein
MSQLETTQLLPRAPPTLAPTLVPTLQLVPTPQRLLKIPAMSRLLALLLFSLVSLVLLPSHYKSAMNTTQSTIIAATVLYHMEKEVRTF